MSSRERVSKPLDFTKAGTCRAEDPVVSPVGANPAVPVRGPVLPQHFQTCRSGQSQHAVVFHFGPCFRTRYKRAVPGPVPWAGSEPCSWILYGHTTQSTDEQVVEGDRNLVHVVVKAGRTASKQPSGYLQPTSDVSCAYLSHYLLLLTMKHNGAPLAGHPVTYLRRIWQACWHNRNWCQSGRESIPPVGTAK